MFHYNNNNNVTTTATDNNNINDINNSNRIIAHAPAAPVDMVFSRSAVLRPRAGWGGAAEIILYKLSDSTII